MVRIGTRVYVTNSTRIAGYTFHPEMAVALNVNYYTLSRAQYSGSMQGQLNSFVDPEYSRVAARRVLSSFIHPIIPSDILEDLLERVTNLVCQVAERECRLGLEKLEVNLHADIVDIPHVITDAEEMFLAHRNNVQPDMRVALRRSGEENYSLGFGTVPASESAIESLKKCVVEEAARSTDECTVCQERYVVGQIAACMPCKHQYHAQCIERWLRFSNVCPLCRAKLTHA